MVLITWLVISGQRAVQSRLVRRMFKLLVFLLRALQKLDRCPPTVK